MVNFLETLAAEWYQYQGYFVRTNVKFARRTRGGWDGEMDVIGFNPRNSELIHIETSTDAYSHAIREDRFKRKFKTAREHYKDPDLFPYKGHLKQIAILGFAKPRTKFDFGKSVEIISIPEFMELITSALKNKNPSNSAIPETYPLLRAIQYSSFYCK